MTELTEKTKHLANLLVCAAIDGHVGKRERWFIEKACARLFVRDDDRAAAEAAVAEHPKRLYHLRSPFDRRHCVEDVLVLGYIDGVMHIEEKKVVLELAKHLVISQADFDRLRSSAKRKAKDLNRELAREQGT